MSILMSHLYMEVPDRDRYGKIEPSDGHIDIHVAVSCRDHVHFSLEYDEQYVETNLTLEDAKKVCVALAATIAHVEKFGKAF